jgi:glycosyltransferase involved in cell wall biosynthesis
VVVIANGLNCGGAERVASLLANYLDEKGYEVSFIAVYSDVREYALNERIAFIYIKKSLNIRFGNLMERNFRIYKEMKRLKPDIVISFNICELLLTQMMGIPVIHTLRNDPESVDNTFGWKQARNYAFRHAKYVVFQTKGAQKYFSIDIVKKSSIIPNPLNTSILPFWSAGEHNKTFVTACRLNKQKNIPMLIHSFISFHKDHPDYSLEIYGEGELKAELNDLIQSKNAGDYIILKGRSTSIYDIMAGAFAFILSSDYEGLSNSMLEALAIGLPCICTNCPPYSASEYIDDGINGYLCDVGNTEMMTKKMIEVAGNSIKLDALSKKSKQIRDKLDTQNILRSWVEIIECE